MSISKPMLACDFDASKLQYPILASAKLDGIRALSHNGVMLSRTLKPIPSHHIQATLKALKLDGMDGELIVGEPTAPDCYNRTVSHVMAHDKTFDFTYHVFDIFDSENLYDVRHQNLLNRLQDVSGIVKLHPHVLIHNETQLLTFEQEQLGMGYEGLILRNPVGHYKNGRSTVKEGLLLKVKRFHDAEAEIIGFDEQLKNNNVKLTDERGFSKRSSHQDNMEGKDTLGALQVRDVLTGIEFSIGTGLDDTTRAEIWADRDGFLGQMVKYKSFQIGVKDKPRFPVFLGMRAAEDMV